MCCTEQQINCPGRWCPTALHKADLMKVKSLFCMLYHWPCSILIWESAGGAERAVGSRWKRRHVSYCIQGGLNETERKKKRKREEVRMRSDYGFLAVFNPDTRSKGQIWTGLIGLSRPPAECRCCTLTENLSLEIWSWLENVSFCVCFHSEDPLIIWFVSRWHQRV